MTNVSKNEGQLDKNEEYICDLIEEGRLTALPYTVREIQKRSWEFLGN